MKQSESVYRMFQLSNGIRVVTAPLPRARSAPCAIGFSVGSRFDSKEERGLAHFTEHMFFKGTKRRPSSEAISREIESIGGKMDAGTSKEITVYSTMSAARHRDVALDLLADVLHDPILDEAEIKREMEVVVNEIAIYEDSPSELPFVLLEELLFPDHPLGWEIAGCAETVRGFTRESISRYLDNWYRPERMVIGVGGDVGNGLEKRLEELYGDISPGKTSRPVPVGPKCGSAAMVKKRTTDSAYLAIGSYAYPNRHKDEHVVRVLSALLGEGMSSRLFLELRDRRNLGYSFHSSVEQHSDTGTIAIEATVDSARAEEAVQAIVAELRRAGDETASESEMSRAREYVKGRLAMSADNPQHLLFTGMEDALADGKPVDIDEHLSNYDRVSADDVRRVAKDIFGGPLSLAMVGPVSGNERFLKMMDD